mmetsp:Transcript_2492/g.7299  ORF Transcript_2492/g.7299 Transcript_2492/m.7299 type:complete len:153 (-) Transcript_2492:32-490(-)
MASWDDSDNEDEFVLAPLKLDDDADAPAPAPAADDEAWTSSSVPAPPPAPAPAPAPAKKAVDKPLLLVNFTALSGGAIHNKHDPHACNDPDKKRELSRQVEANYGQYAADAALLAAGDVLPTSTSTWRALLQMTRADRPGQYFAPVFPPAAR